MKTDLEHNVDFHKSYAKEQVRSVLKGDRDIIGSSKNRLIAIRLQHLKLNIYHFC